jgi:hypothetical protein
MMRWSRGVEKNIKAFLDFDLPGRKVLVGAVLKPPNLSASIPTRCSRARSRARI